MGHIVGLQSEEIKQIASEYAEKVRGGVPRGGDGADPRLLTSRLRVARQQSELSAEERSERFGPLQQHRRAVAALEKQIQQRKEQLEEVGPAP